MSVRVLIADDEELGRRALKRILTSLEDLEIVSEAKDGVEALDLITQLHPDLLFLDIEMPGLNAFDVIQNLTVPPLVIFATAYDEYAVRAFEKNAVDYLLKPIDPGRVRQAVEKARGLLKQDRSGYTETVRNLLAELRREGIAGQPRLAVRKGKNIVLLRTKEIVSITLQDGLVFAHTAKDRFIADKNLSDLEEMLERSGFFRINRASLVNLDYVKEIVPWFAGTSKVRLLDGTELDLSRDRARLLRRLMGI